MPDLSKLSDKVLAKFARRSVTMRMVLIATGVDADTVDRAIRAVADELDRRGLTKTDSTDE